jgi:hypothetical protein
MTSIRPRIAGLAGAALVAASVLLATPAVAAAKPGPAGYPSLTCTGGEIPDGQYSSIKVTGDCYIDNSFVYVYGNVEVKPGGMLWTSTDNFLWVRGNINVGRGGVLALGCGIVTCLPAGPLPTSAPTRSSPFPTWAYVGGSIDANDALMVLVVGVQVVKNIDIDGGGGGQLSCGSGAPVSIKDGNPFPVMGVVYSTVGGSLEVDDTSTCAIVIALNLVNNNVYDNDNTTYCGILLASCLLGPVPAGTTPGSNVIFENYIGNNLSCKRNVPPPDLYWENFVGGHVSGQCAVVPVP